MSDQPSMCYVAADPSQPGAAWAAAVDDPKYAKDNAKEIAEWLKDGATVMRVPTAEARDMLQKWERPEEKSNADQLSLL